MKEWHVEIYGSTYLDEDGKQVSGIFSCKRIAESDRQILQDLFEAKVIGDDGTFIPIASAAMIRITEAK